MLRVPAACCALPGAVCALLLAGCATLPPGHDFPRGAPLPLSHTANTMLTGPLAAAGRAHPSESGFRMFSVGVDGLLLRLQLIAAARRSLDLQYYIFHGDESGRLIRRPAARRVRILTTSLEATNNPLAQAGYTQRLEVRLLSLLPIDREL